MRGREVGKWDGLKELEHVMFVSRAGSGKWRNQKKKGEKVELFIGKRMLH